MDVPQFSLPKPLPEFALLPVEIIFTITENFVNFTTAHDKDKLNNRSLLALSLVSRRFNAILARDLVKYNMQHMGGRGLRWAIAKNNIALADKFLKNGGSIASAQQGYPLVLAVKKGGNNIDMLNFLLGAASKEQVALALKQEINDKHDTVLHRAIRLANVPCVKALLEAGADPALVNNCGSRPVEYLYELRGRDEQYAEIIRLLLQMHPAEMLRDFEDLDAKYGSVREERMTPLMAAVVQRCPKTVSLILEAGVKHFGSDKFFHLVDEGNYGAVIPHIFDAVNWNRCGQEQCDRILAIAKLLVGDSTNANRPVAEYSYLLYLSCSVPCGIVHQQGIPNIMRLQRDMIRLLIQSGADINQSYSSYSSQDSEWALVTFMHTAEFYIMHFLQPSLPHMEVEEILQDSHALFMSEEHHHHQHPQQQQKNTSLPSRTVSTIPEQHDEQTAILELLQEIFSVLLGQVKEVDHWGSMDYATLLFHTIDIPGAFGFFATSSLLEKGAHIYWTDADGNTPYDSALDNPKSPAPVCSLMRSWRKKYRPRYEA